MSALGWFTRFFKRTSYLHIGHDQGTGPLVVLLHGIGQTSKVWQPLYEQLADAPCRVVAFDLLGFGESPKPSVNYTADNHADAVIESIQSLRPKAPIIIVGHSMGALVAARIAFQQPNRVKHLVLYGMPIYEGLPDTPNYQWRVDAYYALYKQIAAITPTQGRRKLGVKIIQKITGQEVTDETWRAYVLSLKNTIIKQETAKELKQLTMPIDVIYGSRDMLVIRGKVRHIFGSKNERVTAHTIKERHKISKRAGTFIAGRIRVALAAGEDADGHSKLRDIRP